MSNEIFEVGQRVRVRAGTDSLYAGENAVVEKLHGSGPVVVVGDGSRLLYLESELEPIETFQPGDIVRAEKGDEIIQTEVCFNANYPDSDMFLQVSYNEDFFDLEGLQDDGYTLTLVKRPEPEIVLPRKKNALIEIDSWLYIRGFGGAWSTIGNFARVSHSTMETRARKSGFYRVIFEGENE